MVDGIVGKDKRDSRWRIPFILQFERLRSCRGVYWGLCWVCFSIAFHFVVLAGLLICLAFIIDAI